MPPVISLLFLLSLMAAPEGASVHVGQLTFQQRVDAQRAIERVYYSHQIGASKPFEEAVPDGVIERKVRAYLEESFEMERSLGIPLTSEALAEEAARMARDTRMPGRLAELHAALGNDPLLIQESLARPSLLRRRAQDPAVADPDSLTAASCAPGDTWLSTLLSQPGPAGNAGVVWTGSLLFARSGRYTGAVYDPVLDTWTTISLIGSPTCTAAPIWTGQEVIVWCPGDGSPQNGGRYDPVADSWRSMAGLYDFRYWHSVVWAGDRMIVWGGICSDPDCYPFSQETQDPVELGYGFAYHPDTDTWSGLLGSNAPSARALHAAVWTGTRMMVWGGQFDYTLYVPGEYDPLLTQTLGDGGLYDPVTDTWEHVSNSSPPASRRYHTVLWTGTDVLIWGGQTRIEYFDGYYQFYDQWHDSGGKYNPTTHTWTPITSTSAPSARGGAGAVWTGREAIVWGGSANPGAIYDPAAGSWRPMSLVNAPADMSSSSVAWDGEAMLVYGGASAGRGGRYVPDDGAGLADSDQDGFSPCDGDCDDTSASAHPGVAEACDAVDNNCDGRVDEGGQPDADADGYAAGCGDCDDGNPSVYAAAPQVCGDGLNNNCLHPSWPSPGSTNEGDDDGDSYSECQSDCDDTRAGVHPGGPQICDGLNNDCSHPGWPSLAGTNDADDDTDSFSECQGDCDDMRPSVSPGGVQICDGLNNDCNHQNWPSLQGNEADDDTDSFSECQGDCDDARASVHPGAPEICDGLNNDCSDPAWPTRPPADRDQDGDGYATCGSPVDCLDAAPSVWSAPTPARDLLWLDIDTMRWSSPAQPGATRVVYDVLRSDRGGDFGALTFCAAFNEMAPFAGDSEIPFEGAAFYYLVRVENSCPPGQNSNMGADSSGVPRTGRDCP